MSFRDEPLNVKLYIAFISFLGLVFLLFNIPNISEIRVERFLFFVVLHILLEHLDIPLPRGSGAVSVSFAIDLAIILLFGPAAAAWISFTNVIYLKSLKHIKEMLHKLLFNGFQIALATGVAGYVYIYAGGALWREGFPPSLNDIVPVIFAALAYFILNSSLVMLVIKLSQKVSFWGVWLTNFRWAIPNYFATLPLGILIAIVFINMREPGILLLIIPLMVARQTFIMYMDMRNQYLSTIKALTKAIDAKDHYTHGHSERVAKYAVWIGEEMRLPEDFLEKLEYLALMHDIGKIGIPEQILNKPSRLSDEEFDLVRSHSAVGADIISNIKYIGEHADIVRHHHERMDGRGYPDGLTEDKISLGAKIVGVADSFDAMTSKRVYSRTLSKQDAVEELRRCCNSQFCQDVVNAFVRVLERKGEMT